MKGNREKFGEWVKRAREERGWTEERLSRETGLSFATIVLVEAGGQVTAEIRRMIERILGPQSKVVKGNRETFTRHPPGMTPGILEEKLGGSRAIYRAAGLAECPECGGVMTDRLYEKCPHCGRFNV